MTECASAVYEPRVVWGDLDLTALPFILEFGYNLGNGVTVYDELESLLRDGTLVTSTQTGNRQLKLSVLIKPSIPGTQALADAGVLLDTETNRQTNTVTVYPGDYGEPGAGPALVLETFIAQSDEDGDGDLERAGYRRFLLTIPALPGVRSVGLTTINWTGPGVMLRAVNSTSGWTNRGSGTLSVSSGRLTNSVASMQLRTTPTNPLRAFIHIRSNAASLTNPSVVIGGVAIPNAEVGKFPAANNADVMIIEVPEQFIGTTPVIDFDIPIPSGSPFLIGFWTTNYPNLPPGTEPGGAGIGSASTDAPSANFGIDHIDVGGTARTGCTITFTAPTGGAFVYTARNPVESLRERGLSEIVFGRFTWAAEGTVTISNGVMWFPPGTHYTQIGRTAPQPPPLNPNGIWPQAATGLATIGTDAAASQYTYPADELAAISFFNTTGAKNLISAAPDLPAGYQGDAVVFEEHLLHPDGTGFAVLDINGAPIATTITYYKRWKHHPAEAS